MKRRADFEDLRHECRIVGDPVAHHDAATWSCDADHLLGDIEGLGRKHGAEHGERQIKRVVGDSVQAARVSFIKLQTVETCLCSSPVSGFHEVPGDVDSSDFSPHKGQRHRRGAVSAAEVQGPQRQRYPDRIHDRFARFTHEGSNLCKVAFFPQCFVWIHDKSFQRHGVLVDTITFRFPAGALCTSDAARVTLSDILGTLPSGREWGTSLK